MAVLLVNAELNTPTFHVSFRPWILKYVSRSADIRAHRYNSAISVSIPQYGYPTVVASESFVHGTDYSIGNWTDIILQGVSPEGYNQWPPMEQWDHLQAFQSIQANASNSFLYQRLENRQCIEKYNDVFSDRSSLVVVTEDLSGDKNASVHQYIYWPATYGGFSRYNPCDSGDGLNENLNCQTLNHNTPKSYKNWKRFDRAVLYCLSQRISHNCQLNYSPTILIGT